MGQKDDKYWEKRGKNNVAARRSREARRLKENQIALRTAYLEKQNYGLKAALQDVNMKNEKLALEKKILIGKPIPTSQSSTSFDQKKPVG